jgi:heme-degrading monooxygenase HmoA
MNYSKGVCAMFIAVNKLAGPGTEHGEAILQGFKQAIPGMKQFKGFRGMEIWTASDGSVSAVSRWDSEAALEEYTSSPLFGHHHGSPSQHGAPGSQHSSADAEKPQSQRPSSVLYYNAEILD